MFNPLVIALGKTVQAVAGLRGGGSSLPGLLVEKLDSNFAPRVLSRLPQGVVVISGTNGKTTTTKIVCDLLVSTGLRVFTNNSGSNFMRGVISSLLRTVSLNGKLDADIAVLELDEAHAVDFSRRIAPRHTLLLNVMRDQLDRFGEIDYTASLLTEVARNTTETLVLNREDRRIAAIAGQPEITAATYWYGLAQELLPCFPEDDELHVTGEEDAKTARPEKSTTAEVVLLAVGEEQTSYLIAGHKHTARLALKGIYNAFNAAAALTLVRVVLAAKNAILIPSNSQRYDNDERLITALSAVTSAFGRGEEIQVGQTSIELLLVKNPAGFRLALESFAVNEHALMIAINDEYADGRDMSWLYDVSFASLRANGVAQLTGTRAYDMALRLHYDDVSFANVEPDLIRALNLYIATQPARPHRIYCTYTAMLAIRRYLATLTSVSKAM